jgi:glutamate--cysteine ligase catalytic subunit
MGFLTDGMTFTWKKSLDHIELIKNKGIKQFIDVYLCVNNKSVSLPTNFLFGDEVEYSIYSIDDVKKKVSLSLKNDKLFELLESDTQNKWLPEYAKYMIECIPSDPYSFTIDSLMSLEKHHHDKMNIVNQIFANHENEMTNKKMTMLSMSPILGTHKSDSEYKHDSDKNLFSKSLIVTDNVISKHNRYGTLTNNIRNRRNKKVTINVPIYQDVNTKLNSIVLDCMAFGMGSSCLQQTYQLRNEDEARYIYDTLAIISPIMLAITAASPVINGYMTNNDCRWSIISQSVDDRNDKEMMQIPKSRYDSINYYISRDAQKTLEILECNDVYSLLNDDYDDELKKIGVDDLLLQHIKYLFVRDPLVIYEKDIIDKNNSAYETNHFDNINSTNWNTVRLKIPQITKNMNEITSSLGWRVEFRPMELQKDTSSNVSLLIFMVILVKTLINTKVDWYIPISLLDKNMERSQEMDAITKNKFYFKVCNEIKELDINEIMNTTVNIIGMMKDYVKKVFDEKEYNFIEKHIDFVRDRTNGNIMTDAKYIREFIESHHLYEKDSIVCNEIVYDLIKTL